MIVQLFEAAPGTSIDINPVFVISVRPDPADPDNVSIVKLSDGESLRIRGGHDTVAARLSRPSAAA